MGGEDKIDGWDISLEVIVIVLVKIDGLNQGSVGGDGEIGVDFRDD